MSVLLKVNLTMNTFANPNDKSLTKPSVLPGGVLPNENSFIRFESIELKFVSIFMKIDDNQ